MSKKNTQGRKPGGAAGISTISEDIDQVETDFQNDSDNGDTEMAAAPKRTAKPKVDQPSEGNFGVSEIKKAAAFVNSVGGLDKAMTLLQILKVAKEVQ